jgi:hypothetical protein
MREQRHLWHKHIYPVWADGNKLIILLCAALGLTGGVGSAALLHSQNECGLYVLPIGFVGVLGYGKFYIQELYDRYLACGWDMYF